MATRINVEELSLKLNSKLVQKLHQQNASKIWLSFRIKASFSKTQSKSIPLYDQKVSQNTIEFAKSSPLLFQSDQDMIEITLHANEEDSRQKLDHQVCSVQEFLKKKDVIFTEKSTQTSCTLQYQVYKQSLTDIKTLEMKSFIVELLSLQGKVEEFMVQISCQNDVYRSMTIETKFFWEEPMKIFITDQKAIKMELIKKNQQIVELSTITFSEFPEGSNFKRNLLTNKENFPFGCLSFEYKTEGQWNYEHTQQAELLCKQELYKIQILKIKGKLKEPHSNWDFKIVSDINKLDLSITSESQTTCEVELNNHLYSCQPKCNFMLFCEKGENSMACNATMNLQMIGKFEKLLQIKELKTNTKVGTLFVHTQCLKVDTMTLKFKKIHLKLIHPEKSGEKEVFIKGEVGGCFGKTQEQNLTEQINFIKTLQVKFSKEENVNLVVTSQDEKKKQSISINLAQLEQKSDKKISMKFGNEDSFLQGELNCQFQFVPKQNKDKSQGKKNQIQMQGYNQNLSMKEQIIEKAASLPKNHEKQQKENVNVQEQDIQSNSENLSVENIVPEEKVEREDKKQIVIEEKKEQIVEEHKDKKISEKKEEQKKVESEKKIELAEQKKKETKVQEKQFKEVEQKQEKKDEKNNSDLKLQSKKQIKDAKEEVNEKIKQSAEEKKKLSVKQKVSPQKTLKKRTVSKDSKIEEKKVVKEKTASQKQKKQEKNIKSSIEPNQKEKQKQKSGSQKQKKVQFNKKNKNNTSLNQISHKKEEKQKTKEEPKVSISNHLTDFKLTRKRFQQHKKNKSSSSDKEERKRGSKHSSLKNAMKKQRQKEQNVENKFKHILDVYLGDRKQQQMLIRRKFQRDNERNNKTTHDKVEKNPIDLPEIKVYNSKKGSSYMESAQQFSKKRYASPRSKES